MDFIIRTGLVGEKELWTGMMISKIDDECKLEKLSLESLNVLNAIRVKVEPENIAYTLEIIKTVTKINETSN
nr:hypothetical protein MACL_00001048 [Theileria orientalis]